MPFFIANTPFCQWTLTAATIMTETTSAGPTGPSRPSVTSAPPVISAAAAMGA